MIRRKTTGVLVNGKYAFERTERREKHPCTFWFTLIFAVTSEIFEKK